jgi:hypothetical protein
MTLPVWAEDLFFDFEDLRLLDRLAERLRDTLVWSINGWSGTSPAMKDEALVLTLLRLRTPCAMLSASFCR